MTPTPPDEFRLADLDPTGRFSDRAVDYVKYRPDYPKVAFEVLITGLGEPAKLTAADVGAGTGISARGLASLGPRVFAVEPNAAMRAVASPDPRVEWREGTSEATGLPAAGMDLVLCAQAFHWFRALESLIEFHRILRPGGRLALVWNKRDDHDPLTLGYKQAIQAVNGEHPAERRPFDHGLIAAGGRFTAPRRLVFDHAQTLDQAGLVGRAISASYVPKAGPAFDELVRRLHMLHAKYRDSRGVVTLRYVTEVWLADRLGDGS